LKFFLENLIFIYGDDEFRLSFVLQKEIKKQESNGFRLENVDFLDQNFSQNKLIQSLSQGLFSEKKFLLLKNLFSQNFLNSTEIFEILKSKILNLDKNIQIIIFHSGLVKGEKNSKNESLDFFNWLLKNAKVFLVNILSKNEIVKKIYALANSEFKTPCNIKTCERIVDISGDDLSTSINNLKILSSYSGFEKNINDLDLKNLYQSEISGEWEFSNQVFSGLKKSLKSLEKQLASGFDPHKIFGGVLSQISNMIIVSVLNSDSSNALKPFVFRKAKENLRMIKKSINYLFKIIFDLDFDIKKGVTSPKEALLDFLVKINL